MPDGDVVFARFPVTLDLNAPADTTAQVGLVTPVIFNTFRFPDLQAKILPMTGGGGTSRGVVLVVGRDVS